MKYLLLKNGSVVQGGHSVAELRLVALRMLARDPDLVMTCVNVRTGKRRQWVEKRAGPKRAKLERGAQPA